MFLKSEKSFLVGLHRLSCVVVGLQTETSFLVWEDPNQIINFFILNLF